MSPSAAKRSTGDLHGLLSRPVQRLFGGVLPSHLAKATRLGQRNVDDVSALITEVGRFDALHREQSSQLAAVVDVVGHDAPDRPLARDRVGVALVGLQVGLPEVGDRPSGEVGLDHLPTGLEPSGYFCRAVGASGLR